jgi:hypothetical protein
MESIVSLVDVHGFASRCFEDLLCPIELGHVRVAILQTCPHYFHFWNHGPPYYVCRPHAHGIFRCVNGISRLLSGF